MRHAYSEAMPFIRAPAPCSNLRARSPLPLLRCSTNTPTLLAPRNILPMSAAARASLGDCALPMVMQKKVIWFYGLPCSGKTTLANALREELEQRGHRICMLDGDVLRTGLNSDLGFSDVDRCENLRRAAHVAKLVIDLGFVVIAAFVTPTQRHRALIREVLSSDDLLMVYVDCPLEVCMQRDVKGMYAKAKAGQMQNMTGLQGTFEVESDNVLVLHTENATIADGIDKIIHCIS